MTGFESSCDVSLGSALVGVLKAEGDRLTLDYADAWRATGFPLSPALPLTGQPADGAAYAFFENLLPEGEAMDQLVAVSQISRRDVLALSLALSQRNDLPGAVRLMPRGKAAPKIPNAFRPVTAAEIEERLNHPDTKPLTVWDGAPRLSVAGVQMKLNVLKRGEAYGLAQGERLASDRILKFEKPAMRHLVLNEFLTMHLAASLGHAVAPTKLLRVGAFRALEVLRFDRRVEVADGQWVVKRRPVIDACQALGKTSSLKYECPFGRGYEAKPLSLGVSFAALCGLAAHAADPMAMVTELLDWRLFNLIVGNTDAHGKNMSFFVSRRGLSVAPWYDLVSVELIDGVDHTLAMGVDDEFDPDQVHALQLLYEAEAAGIERALVPKRLALVLERLKAGLATALAKASELNDEERAFAADYQQFMAAKIDRWERELAVMPALLADATLF